MLYIGRMPNKSKGQMTATEYITLYRAIQKVYPWERAYTNIHQRCNNPNDPRWRYYGGRGIQCLVKSKDLKRLFFRDKAWKLRMASVDRINPDGDYIARNVRWIEHSENSRTRGINNAFRQKEYLKLKFLVVKYFNRTKWPIYVQRTCLARMREELINLS